MAVYCGVCGTRIFNAAENDGSFQVNADFHGWDVQNGRARISDTCERCAAKLRAAITKVANRIADRNKKQVDERRQMRESQASHEAKVQKDRDDFEREWNARRIAKGL